MAKKKGSASGISRIKDGDYGVAELPLLPDIWMKVCGPLYRGKSSPREVRIVDPFGTSCFPIGGQWGFSVARATHRDYFERLLSAGGLLRLLKPDNEFRLQHAALKAVAPNLRNGDWVVLEHPIYAPTRRTWIVFPSGRRCHRKRIIIPSLFMEGVWVAYALHQPTKEEWALPAHCVTPTITTVLLDNQASKADEIPAGPGQ